MTATATLLHDFGLKRGLKTHLQSSFSLVRFSQVFMITISVQDTKMGQLMDDPFFFSRNVEMSRIEVKAEHLNGVFQ